MKRDCSTCICKEGSCYPSTTIFDKDKTCKSYTPDYEGYITDLEKENAELKEKLNFSTQYYQGEKVKQQLTNAKELIKEILEEDNYSLGLPKELRLKTEQFISEVEK